MDLCGNYCDADFNQDGITNIKDFGLFGQAFGKVDCGVFGKEDCEKYCICIGHVVPGCTVNICDFGRFGQRYLKKPGPSGTTPGLVACPL